jgi:uncharacterized membrane protein (UPF0182 family)
MPAYRPLREFPELAYGPEQVEARIDQDTRISQELTLWDQSGSRVIRGNLLVIPIQDSLLYVEPLYLQSTGSDLPELKRVIVAYGNQVAMEPTFGEALGSVFGRAAAGTAPTAGASSTQPKPTPKPGAAAPPGDVKSLVAQANQSFQRAQDAQRRGDWAAYGDELKRLQSTLNELQQRTR